jgi:hypothetical protein
MARTACKITKTEIERVLKAAIDGGFKPARFEVEGGKIVVYAAGSVSNDNASTLDNWRLKNGEG